MSRSIVRLACLVFMSTIALATSAAKAQLYDYYANSASYENIYVDSFGRVNVVGLQVWFLDGLPPGSGRYIFIGYDVYVDGVRLGGNLFSEDISGTPAISRDSQNPDSANINLQSGALTPGWHTVTISEWAWTEDWFGQQYYEVDQSDCRYFQTQVYVP